MEKQKVKEFLWRAVFTIPIYLFIGFIIFFSLKYLLFNNESSKSKEVEASSETNNLKTEEDEPYNYFEEDYMVHTVLLSYKYEFDSLTARDISYKYFKNFNAGALFANGNMNLEEVLFKEDNPKELQSFITSLSDSTGISKKILSAYIFDLRIALKGKD